jgi:hypothetical protein
MLLMGAGSLLYSVSMFFRATSLPYRFSLPRMATGLVMTSCSWPLFAIGVVSSTRTV